MTLTGGCHCGQATYTITAPLRNARSCHCSRCRKIFSGAGSAYAEVDAGAFTWTSGAEGLRHYATAQGWSIAFCGRCGSTLAASLAGEVRGVMLGGLDGDPGVALDMHVFVGSRAPWDHIGGDAPQYDTWPDAPGSLTR
jgi:hypothetical protein